MTLISRLRPKQSVLEIRRGPFPILLREGTKVMFGSWVNARKMAFDLSTGGLAVIASCLQNAR
jgi:hypothetical protein